MYHILPMMKKKIYILKLILNENGRLYFTCRSHNVPIYMKVQIIHQAVAKTKTVLSAKVTLMNTRPTVTPSFYVFMCTLHILLLYYILYLYIFFCLGLHIMHVCEYVHIYLPTLHTQF